MELEISIAAENKGMDISSTEAVAPHERASVRFYGVCVDCDRGLIHLLTKYCGGQSTVNVNVIVIVIVFVTVT